MSPQAINCAIQKLEPLRRQLMLKTLAKWITWIFALCLVIAMFLLRPYTTDVLWPYAWLVPLCAVVAGFVAASRASHLESEFRQAFEVWKMEVLADVLEECNVDFTKCLSKDVYDGSGMFKGCYNQYFGGNFLSYGRISTSNLTVQHQFQETYSETVTETDSQGHSQTRSVQKTRTVTHVRFSGFWMHGVIKPRRHCEIICVPRDWEYVPPADLQPMSLPQGDMAARISTYVSQRHDASILMTPTVLFHLGRLVCLLANCAPYIRLHNGQIDIAVCGYRMTYGGIPSRWRTLTRAGLTDSYEEIRRKTSLIKLVSDQLLPAFE